MVLLLTAVRVPMCVLRPLDEKTWSRPPVTTFGRCRLAVSRHAAHAPRHLLRQRPAAGAESARWLSSPSKKVRHRPTARPLSSPPFSVRAIGAGRPVDYALGPPPWPLSLTVPRIYPYRRVRISCSGHCLHHGEARHSSACGHDTIPEASGHDEEHSEDFVRDRHR